MDDKRRIAISKALKDAIRNDHIYRAFNIIKKAERLRDCSWTGLCVSIVLDEKNSPPELIEAALDVFLASRKDCYGEHSRWVGYLTCFICILWERRMTGWLKEFYKVSLQGAVRLRDYHHLDSLLLKAPLY